MMKAIDMRWSLISAVCLLAAVTLGCEKESQAPAKPQVVVKKIAVAKKAAAKPAKPAASAAKKPAAKPAPTPAKPVAAASAATASPAPAPAASAPSQASPGTEGPPPKKATALSDLAAMTRPRTYDPDGRLNPFTPLFQKKPEEEAENERKPKGRTREVRVPQTPLEKVDLGQLKLVAIMQMQSGPRALVEEASGKGYVVRLGTYMGLHSGQVVEIASDRVIVEEEVQNLLGDYEIKKRELKLQKPLGE